MTWGPQGSTSCGLCGPMPASEDMVSGTPAARSRSTPATPSLSCLASASNRLARSLPGSIPGGGCPSGWFWAAVTDTTTPRAASWSTTAGSCLTPSAVRDRPCSMPSNPAATASAMPWAPCACPGQPGPVRLLGDRPQLGRVVLRLPQHRAEGEVAAGHHHLDHVDPAAGQRPHRLPHPLDAGGLAAEEPAVPTRGGNRRAGHQQLRALRGVGGQLLAE